MSAENGPGYNTFEQPPPYPDSYKNEPYQSQQQLRPDQYYPLPDEPLQASQQRQTNITVIDQQPVVVCRTVVVSKPNNYLTFSIINFLCCCWCLGLFALMYSLRVDSEYAAGRTAGAIHASLMAKRLNLLGFTFGFILIVGSIIAIVAVTLANVDSDDYDYYSSTY